MVENTFRLGCERFFKTKWLRCQGRRIGLFTHLAAVDAELVPTIDRVAALDGLTLAAIFTPEHGLYGVAQAGQEIGDELHQRYGMPVYSLYGTRKKPISPHSAICWKQRRSRGCRCSSSTVRTR